MTEVVLCGFAAHLADVGLKHPSIKTYMSEVRFFQIKAGCNDPFQGAQMPWLEYVMRGIKKNKAKSGSSSREHLSITPVILRSLGGCGQSQEVSVIRN